MLKAVATAPAMTDMENGGGGSHHSSFTRESTTTDDNDLFNLDDLDLTQSLSASMLLGIKQVMLTALAGSRPLDIHTACSLGDCDAAKQILKEDKAAAWRRNWCGWTPLMYAAHMGHDVIVDLLLDNGAPVDDATTERDTALIQAAAMGKESVIYTLLQRGANVNAARASGVTPLYAAAANGQTHVVKLLLSRGAAVDARDTTTGNTPLLAAIHEGSASSVRVLLDAGADTAVRNSKGHTCRDVAQHSPHPDVTILNLLELNEESSGKDGPMRGEAALVAQPLPDSPPRSRTSSHTAPPQPRAGLYQRPELNLTLGDVHDVHDLLKCLKLEKYIPVFEKAEVDFAVLLSMSEQDLKDIGLNVFGPRRKIFNALQRLKRHSASPKGSAYDTRQPHAPSAPVGPQRHPAPGPSSAVRRHNERFPPSHPVHRQQQSPSLSAARATASPPKLQVPHITRPVVPPHVHGPVSTASVSPQRIAPPRLPTISPGSAKQPGTRPPPQPQHQQHHSTYQQQQQQQQQQQPPHRPHHFQQHTRSRPSSHVSSQHNRFSTSPVARHTHTRPRTATQPALHKPPSPQQQHQQHQPQHRERVRSASARAGGLRQTTARMTIVTGGKAARRARATSSSSSSQQQQGSSKA